MRLLYSILRFSYLSSCLCSRLSSWNSNNCQLWHPILSICKRQVNTWWFWSQSPKCEIKSFFSFLKSGQRLNPIIRVFKKLTEFIMLVNSVVVWHWLPTFALLLLKTRTKKWSGLFLSLMTLSIGRLLKMSWLPFGKFH